MGSTRDHRIDFWRGLALLSIFINHVPGNPLASFTHRNFGWSDSAEAFVFLAGFAAALAYWPKFRAGEEALQTAKSWRRAWTLYVAHLASVAIAIALFAWATIAFRDPSFLDQINIRPFMDDPVRGMVGVVTMGHQLGFFNILPMYVCFLLGLPLMMGLARLRLELALAVSATLYGAAHIFGWNLPQYPTGGSWFFNPLAWQFLFVIGFTAGALVRDGRPLPAHPLATAAAGAYLAASALMVLVGYWPDPKALGLPAALVGTEKTNLDLPRLLHVLALAYLLSTTGFARWLKGWLTATNPIVLVGRASLPIFCMGSVLAVGLQILRARYQVEIGTDLLLVETGIALHLLMAQVIAWYDEAGRRKPAPAAAPKPQPAPVPPVAVLPAAALAPVRSYDMRPLGFRPVRD